MPGLLLCLPSAGFISFRLCRFLPGSFQRAWQCMLNEGTLPCEYTPGHSARAAARWHIFVIINGVSGSFSHAWVEPGHGCINWRASLLIRTPNQSNPEGAVFSPPDAGMISSKKCPATVWRRISRVTGEKHNCHFPIQVLHPEGEASRRIRRQTQWPCNDRILMGVWHS